MSALRRQVAEALAQAFLTGTWHVRTLMARGDDVLDAGGPWLRALAFEVVQRWPEAPVDQPAALSRAIEAHPAFREAWRRGWIPRRVARVPLLAPVMAEPRWPVPVLSTPGDVARWLNLPGDTLDWFSDRRGLERVAKDEALRHYRRRWVARGARLPRLLESPKERLKALQRRVLAEVLQVIPPHEAAQGFVRGRSVLTHAALHTGRRVVVRFDLEAFFTHVSAWRALGVFRSAGYPEEVATTLLGLCTTRTPEAVLRAAPYPEPFSAGGASRRFNLLRRLADWHLPQGAPTSPALANLAAFGLDARLAGYAAARGVTYSRYADDLTFSFDDGPSVGALTGFVRLAAREAGFSVNAEKTRVMHAHQRQRVTGVVVNEKPNIARAEFDALKARLHRLARDGVPAEADLRATLQGRIAWVRQVSPSRAERLLRVFERIAWP